MRFVHGLTRRFGTLTTRRATVGLAGGILAGFSLAADDRAALGKKCGRRQWRCTDEDGGKHCCGRLDKFCCPDGTCCQNPKVQKCCPNLRACRAISQPCP